MRRWLMMLGAAALLAGCGADRPAPAPAAEAAPAVGERSGLRGVRYCEILVIAGGPGRLRGTVYNTIGLNDCPAEQWAALDGAALADELGATSVIMNGPRYFLMDRNTLRNPGAVATFGGLELRELTTLRLPPGAMLRGEREPYVEVAVERETDYLFERGKTVYELLAPGGAAYVMQSYAQIVDPDLGEGDLAGLGARLALPPGWSYRARVLEEDLLLSAAGDARVITDDLFNSYQRVGAP